MSLSSLINMCDLADDGIVPSSERLLSICSWAWREIERLSSIVNEQKHFSSSSNWAERVEARLVDTDGVEVKYGDYDIIADFVDIRVRDEVIEISSTDDRFLLRCNCVKF